MLRITARSAYFHAKGATAAPARRSVQAKLALCLIYVLTVGFGLTISGDCWSQPGCFRKLMTALSEWVLVSCICVFFVTIAHDFGDLSLDALLSWPAEGGAVARRRDGASLAQDRGGVYV